MSTGPTPSNRRGLAAGIGAYGLWGFLPLYLPLLDGAGALEVGAHRVVWALGFGVITVLVVPSLRRSTRALLRDRRTLAGLAIAAVLLAANWITFVLAVFTGRVVDVALGYYINPLMTVLLAVLVLRERLRPAQWIAVGGAAAGVVVITVGYGTLPWIAVVVASTFALYGLAKNRIGRTVPAIPGLVVETAVLTPAALGYLVFLGVTGAGTFAVASASTVLSPTWHSLALIGAGLASLLPLMLFAMATRALPLSTVGLLQFIAPTMQFLIGVLLQGEEMPMSRLAGFILVWASLAVLGVEGYGHSRRMRRVVGPAV